MRSLLAHSRRETLRRNRPLPDRLLVTNEHHPRRAELEDCVRRRFLLDHDARIEHLHPTLLAAQDASDTVHAVVGLNLATHGPLFLEQYLDAPVEEAARHRHGLRPTRDRLVEAGNLVSTRPGGGRFLFASLIEFLRSAGHEWVAYTATAPLRTAFRALQLPFVELGRADGRRLGEDLGEWGTYYDTDPRVCLFEVEAQRWPLRRSLARFDEARLLAEAGRQAGSQWS